MKLNSVNWAFHNIQAQRAGSKHQLILLGLKVLAFYIIIESGKKLLDPRTLRGPFMYYKIIDFLLKKYV